MPTWSGTGVRLTSPTATTTASQQRPLEFPTSYEPAPSDPVNESISTESLPWLFVKHAAQLSVVAAVVTFVLRGSSQPVLSLAYAASSLAFLFFVALHDRQRFEDAVGYATPQVVDVVAPQHVQHALAVQAPDPSQILVPLSHELAAAFTRADVT